MNFKEKLTSVLEFLHLKQKFDDKSLSKEEFNAVVAEYQKKYQVTLNDDLAAEQTAQQTAQQAAEFQTVSFKNGKTSHKAMPRSRAFLKASRGCAPTSRQWPRSLHLMSRHRPSVLLRSTSTDSAIHPNICLVSSILCFP